MPTALPRLEAYLWFAAGLLLLLVGYQLDGITEPGHHAALILGGSIIGYRLGRPR